MENKKQRAFIRSLEKIIANAEDQQAGIIKAMKIGTSNENACIEYLVELNKFMNAAKRMIVQVEISYGENAETLGIRLAGINARLPHTLN